MAASFATTTTCFYSKISSQDCSVKHPEYQLVTSPSHGSSKTVCKHCDLYRRVYYKQSIKICWGLELYDFSQLVCSSLDDKFTRVFSPVKGKLTIRANLKNDTTLQCRARILPLETQAKASRELVKEAKIYGSQLHYVTKHMISVRFFISHFLLKSGKVVYFTWEKTF